MTWIDAPAPLELGDRPGGSAHCIGPPSSRETDVTGYGDAVHQAFLAEFAPTFTLNVHFHRVDQFQWFVRGSAQFAAHDVHAGVVHYADRHTPYGPLVVEDENVAFLTLRSTSDSGAHWMPAGRDDLGDALAVDPRTARRNLTWDLTEPEPEAGTWFDLCTHPDGLRVAVVELDEGQPLPGTHVGGGGGYLGVVRGTIDTDGRLVGSGGFEALVAGDVTAHAAAGVGGCRVALFQFPRAEALVPTKGE